MTTPSHLTENDFQMLAEGQFSQAEFEQLASHFEDCQECASRFDRFGSQVGTLTGLAKRALLEADPILEETGFNELHDWLEKGLAAEGGPAAQQDHQRPLEIGAYRLGEIIGRGGMGVVYRATHTWLNRVVAIKLLRIDAGAYTKQLQHFGNEFEAIGRLDHPNIVRPLDAGCQSGQAFLAMELVDGLDLGHVHRQRGALLTADVAEIAHQAARGLAHAHDNGIIHRDVKPSNLMLARDSTTASVSIKVMDLGLVCFETAIPQSDDAVQAIVGTDGYRAPEQQRSGHVGARADIFRSARRSWCWRPGASPPSPIVGIDPKMSALIRRMMAESADDIPRTNGAKSVTMRVFGLLNTSQKSQKTP